MTQLKSKIVAAPILAIALAIFLAGAINQLPVTSTANAGHTAPEPTTAFPSTTPQQSLAAVTSPLPVLFIAGAILVGLIAALLLFREKGLTKALSE